MDKLRRTRSFQPVLTDIRTSRRPAGTAIRRTRPSTGASRWSTKIADAISAEATELFIQLGRALGGTAEVKNLREAG